MNISSLQTEWLKEEKDKLEKEKARRYSHFDPVITRLDLGRPELVDIWNPTAIVRRAFYPFIIEERKTKKYKKKNGKSVLIEKPRNISCTSHFDALVYSWYAKQLGANYESLLSVLGITHEPIAYRKLGKSNIGFVKEAIYFIKQTGECTAICFDVEHFFDTIDHKILKKAWLKVLRLSPSSHLPDDHYAVFRSVTHYGYIKREELKKVLRQKRFRPARGRFLEPSAFRKSIAPLAHSNPNSFGIPQGSPISDLLSNLYMLDFDEAVATLVATAGGIYRRYSDDILIIVPNEASSAMRQFVMEQIDRVNLKINDAKTEVRTFKKIDGKLKSFDPESGKSARLQYLGIEFDGSQAHLRNQSVTRFHGRRSRKIRGAIAKAIKQKRSISKKPLYEKFSQSRKQNFPSYAGRAASMLGSPVIAKQFSRGRINRKLKKGIDKWSKKYGYK